MRRGARLFVIMGVITIFFTFYTFFYTIPSIESEELAAYTLINSVVWLGAGITEIAVGILFEERLKTKS